MAGGRREAKKVRALPVSLGFLLWGLVLGQPTAPPTGGAAAKEEPAQPLRLEGRWVLDEEGRPVPPRDFERGLQTSALVFRSGELWSIGDQRAEWPGHLLRIDPRTARLKARPIKMVPVDPPSGNPLFDDYRSIRNPDFEGLALDPRDPRTLYGVTEDKRQWIVRVRLGGGEPASSATIDQITPLEFPDTLKPFQNDLNYRVEGIAFSDDGRTIFLAWERAADRLPRLFSLPAEEGNSGKPAHPREVEIDFASLPMRADKPKALLNLNEIQFLREEGRPLLVALARDQERVLVIGLESRRIERTVDLDLRAPGDERIFWVSPEGLAFDTAGDRLWIINDPDSIRGNYRREKDQTASGNFAALAPLLFETRLSTVLGRAAAGAGEKGAAGK
jgi:hypothetical protein